MMSCSGVQMLNQKNLYSKDFLAQINSIELIFRDGDKAAALNRLNTMNDTLLNANEKAKKLNLIGIIQFSQADIDAAVKSFQAANQVVDNDYRLKSQIGLNLASCYFKKTEFDLAYSVLEDTEVNNLTDLDKEKFHKLNYKLSMEKAEFKQAAVSLIQLMSKDETLSDVLNSEYRGNLIENFQKVPSSGRVHLLSDNVDSSPAVIAYLGKLEAMTRFQRGDKSGAEDVISWLGDHFSNNPQIMTFIDDYKNRIENFSKIKSKIVGITIPLHSDNIKKNRNSKAVLAGVTTALMSPSIKDLGLDIMTMDNKGSPFIARKNIQELVTKHHVGAIIGGLYPELALAEYLEAKKYGVLYISLSPVFLPKVEKDHLLIEIPGSVESQISTLFSEEVLTEFGRQMAVLYPWNEAGKSYADEIWSEYNKKNVKVSTINHYEKNLKDYLAPVRKLLGLGHPRERAEEGEIWAEINKARRSKVRIVNKIPPITDFDWVFVPSYPHEAVQIIPTFSYFDAKKITFFGGPSWFSKKLKNNARYLGKMFYVGDDPELLQRSFITEYKDINKANPNLLASRGYESFKLIADVIGKKEFEKRNELDEELISKKVLSGITSNWELNHGVWLKKMYVMRITRRSIKRHVFRPPVVSESESNE